MYHNIFLTIIISTIHHLFLNCDLNVNPVPMKHDAQGTVTNMSPGSPEISNQIGVTSQKRLGTVVLEIFLL